MRFHESIVTRASAERAWELIADLSIHGHWNPHVVDTRLSSSGPPAQGMRYRVTYELSGRRSECNAEIVEFSPPRRFVARLEERQKGDGSHLARFMIETYTIERFSGRTRVTHDVRVEHSGVPWIWRALIWLIQRTGRPVGKTVMQQFAELAEGAVAA